MSVKTTGKSKLLRVLNPAGTFAYTLVGSAIVADRDVTLPLLTGNATLAVLELAQTFTAAVTISAAGAALTLSSATGAIAIGTNPASAGAGRFANAAVVSFRNAGNTADVDALSVNASNQVRLAPGAIAAIISGGGGSVGFFGTTPAVVQASAANLTNSVTAGGTDDTIANFTDLTIYANDAAAIRNDIYQLARKLKQVNDGLRAYGLLT